MFERMDALKRENETMTERLEAELAMQNKLQGELYAMRTEVCVCRYMSACAAACMCARLCAHSWLEAALAMQNKLQEELYVYIHPAQLALPLSLTHAHRRAHTHIIIIIVIIITWRMGARIHPHPPTRRKRASCAKKRWR